MHFRAIAFVIGTLLLVTSIAMLFPIIVSLIYQEGDLSALLISVTVVFSVGFPLWWFRPSHYELSFRDAVLIAVLGWVIISAVSTLPFIIHGSIPSFTDAFFEMVSGYTTTGATILNDIESIPFSKFILKEPSIFDVANNSFLDNDTIPTLDIGFPVSSSKTYPLIIIDSFLKT